MRAVVEFLLPVRAGPEVGSPEMGRGAQRVTVREPRIPGCEEILGCGEPRILGCGEPRIPRFGVP